MWVTESGMVNLAKMLTGASPIEVLLDPFPHSLPSTGQNVLTRGKAVSFVRDFHRFGPQLRVNNSTKTCDNIFPRAPGPPPEKVVGVGARGV